MKSVVLETVQWSSLPDADDIEPIGDRDYAVLSEIGELLSRHGYTQRLGVCLLHRHFELGDDEIATEFTDVDARTSTVKVMKREAAKSADRLETMWRFSQSGSADLATVCVKDCYVNKGHRLVHKTVAK